MKKTGPQDPGTPSGSSLAGKILSWPLEKVDPTYGAVDILYATGLGDACPGFVFLLHQNLLWSSVFRHPAAEF